MTTPVDIIRIARTNVLKTVEGLTLDQINKIPTGFNGNLAWHLGHLCSTEQGLLYRLSGNNVSLEPSFIDKYKKGSVPQGPITQAELDFIKKELLDQLEKLEVDLKQELFKTYTPYTTSFGNSINSFEEALTFVAVHEGIHYGYVLALKRAVMND